MPGRLLRQVLPRRALALGAALLAVPALAAQGQAGPKLLVNSNPAGWYVYGGLHYRGAQWQQMTRALDRAFTGGVSTVRWLTDLSTMLEYDALWVDQRWHAAPTDREVENILAYALTGRRVVVFGENATWGPWNQRLLGALGGREGPLDPRLLYPYVGTGCQYGAVASVGTHQLVRGVGAVNTGCAGYAIGGTALFAYNLATLWGATQNVLTVLDANVVDDLVAGYDAATFRGNVVTWLADQGGARAGRVIAHGPPPPPPSAATVQTLVNPEPGTVALVAGGLLLTVAAGARRRGRLAARG